MVCDISTSALHMRNMSSNVFLFNRGVNPVAQSISGKHTVLNTILKSQVIV